MPRRSLRTVPILAVVLGLAGCSGLGNPARDLAMAVGVTGGEPKAAPDFVSRTRREGNDYIAVGTSAPKPALRSKTPTEISQATTELDTLRATNAAKAAAP